MDDFFVETGTEMSEVGVAGEIRERKGQHSVVTYEERRGGTFWSYSRDGLGGLEDDGVGPLRNFDDEIVLSGFFAVIAFELGAETAGLDADNGVRTGVKGWVAI